MKGLRLPLTSCGRWFVYHLVDGAGVPFYVGLTKRPIVRGGQHAGSVGIIRQRLKDIEASGGTGAMVVIADYATRDEAEAREIYEIGQYPGLLNSMGYGKAARARRQELLEKTMAPISRVLRKSTTRAGAWK